MPVLETIRSWKDEEYRDSLTAEQRAAVPEHPAGMIELDPRGGEGAFGPFRAAQGTITHTCCRPSTNHC